MGFYTKSEILANRRAWINFLKRPDTIKGKQLLESTSNNEARCCLGHACHVLIPETRNTNGGRVVYGNITDWAYAPPLLVDKLGLYKANGEIPNGSQALANVTGATWNSLADYNDNTSITPQQIGEYLETVIEGGFNTPFEHISRYED